MEKLNPEKMYKENLGLIVNISKKFKNALPHYEVDDFTQLGYISIFKAVKEFDPDKGVLFSSFFSRIFNNDLIREARNHKKENNMIYTDDLNKTTNDIIYEEKEINDISKDQVLSKLDISFRDKIVYEMYLNNFSLKEIAICCVITAERVRQIQNIVLNKIKKLNLILT